MDEGGYVYTYGEPGKPISLLRKLTLPDLDIAKKELQEAAKGSYSERSGARDAGVRSWVGFHWGKAVLLRKSGDVIGTNSSDRAGLLVEMIEKFCRVIPKR